MAGGLAACGGPYLVATSILGGFGLCAAWRRARQESGRSHFVSEMLVAEPDANAFMLFAGVSLTVAGAASGEGWTAICGLTAGLLLVGLAIADFSLGIPHVVVTLGMFSSATIWAASGVVDLLQPTECASATAAVLLVLCILRFQHALFQAGLRTRGILSLLLSEEDTPALNAVRTREWGVVLALLLWAMVRGIELSLFGA